MERTDKIEESTTTNKRKSLPLSRNTPEDFEYGFQEPKSIHLNPGKITLRQAMQFIVDHQSNPKKHNCVVLAGKYKLDEVEMG